MTRLTAAVESVASALVAKVESFIEKCRLDPSSWAFSSRVSGAETLYGSCFALMLYHFVGRLEGLSPEDRKDWADYLTSWQDPITGYFVGPELVAGEMRSRKHSAEHVSQHLAVHVLPALRLLGAQPRYPLAFAHPFMHLTHLQRWLDERDWHDAWLEGNNLLFIGQCLIHLRDVEGHPEAQAALDHLFSWLDAEVDPRTGLWGTNGYCSDAAAVYGGYHQLLLYHHEGRAVKYPHCLVDVALFLQHADGGFSPRGGGGACEDVDAVDILVNMYKAGDYRRTDVRLALRRAVDHVLRHQMADGGFVYRINEPFIHMGVARTASPPNQSNLFSTWFRVHTLALIGQVLTDAPVLKHDWRFNESCSMGWHRSWDREQNALSPRDVLKERCVSVVRRLEYTGRQPLLALRRVARLAKRTAAPRHE